MTQAPSPQASQQVDPLLSPAASSAVAHGAGNRKLNDEVVVRCAGLSKTFKDFWLRNRVRAVDNIDLDIRRGEVFGLLGPNGSGKSTTIKMILGLLHPTAGRISVFGKRPDDVNIKKNIGYLPEESYLYRFLNARETLEYYGRLFHQSNLQSKRRIDMLLEMVGLESAQRRPVGEYSKGMQRRIGLAQALINDPQLLILDEPTTGLDPIGTRQIKDLIVELANRGKTILLCSHLLSDVEDVCDRVSIMFGGKVRAQGTCDELLVQENATTLQTAALDDETIEEIEQLLAKKGLSIDRVSRPRQRLEQLFLDIVHKAQSEGASTSGARAGGKIAGFLMEGEERSAHLPEDVQARKIVDELVAGTSATSATPAPETAEQHAAAQQARQAAQKAQAQQQQVLDSLVKPKAAPPTAENQGSDASSSSGQASSATSSGDAPKPAPRPQPQADLGLINELIGQRTTASPQRVEPGPQAIPPADEKPQPESQDKPSQDKSSQDKPASTDGDGEKPDSSFLDALNQVPPYDESKDDSAGKNNPRK